jgi:hypothetical protein
VGKHPYVTGRSAGANRRGTLGRRDHCSVNRRAHLETIARSALLAHSRDAHGLVLRKLAHPHSFKIAWTTPDSSTRQRRTVVPMAHFHPVGLLASSSASNPTWWTAAAT